MQKACPVDPQPVSWPGPTSLGLCRRGRRLGGTWLARRLHPGLPTTIFLILASYCFARSCPWLEDRLLRIPLFAPYMRVLDEGRGMSKKAAASALVSMWSCVALSLVILDVAGRLGPWVAAFIVGLAGIGSATILFYARKSRPAGEKPPTDSRPPVAAFGASSPW